MAFAIAVRLRLSRAPQSLAQKAQPKDSIAGPRLALESGCLRFFDWSSVAPVVAPGNARSHSAADDVRARPLALLLGVMLSAVALIR